MEDQFEVRVVETPGPPLGQAAGFAWYVLRDGRAVQCGWSAEAAQASLDASHAAQGWQSAKIDGVLWGAR